MIQIAMIRLMLRRLARHSESATVLRIEPTNVYYAA